LARSADCLDILAIETVFVRLDDEFIGGNNESEERLKVCALHVIVV
jgi:hypothetical protein